MKIFRPQSIDEYKELVDYIAELDQPVHIYRNDTEDIILVSETEIETPEEKITELLENKEVVNPETVLDGEILTQDDLDELADFFDGI